MGLYETTEKLDFIARFPFCAWNFNSRLPSRGPFIIFILNTFLVTLVTQMPVTVGPTNLFHFLVLHALFNFHRYVFVSWQWHYIYVCSTDMCINPVLVLLPDAVRKRFHSIFGQTVTSTGQRQSPQDTSHVYHSAVGFLQQRQKLEGHINEPYQVHIQDLCEIFQLHPLCWADRHCPASIIHQPPQTCTTTITTHDLTVEGFSYKVIYQSRDVCLKS